MQLGKREGIKYAWKRERKSAKNVNSTEKRSNTIENVALCGGGGGGMHNPLDSLKLLMTLIDMNYYHSANLKACINDKNENKILNSGKNIKTK